MNTARVLLTGFEPFGGASSNSSQLVVEEIEGRAVNGVVTSVLPTSYERSVRRLHDLVDAHRPSTLLMLGLAEGARRPRLEQVALNLDDAFGPDNDGEERVRRKIIADGPVGYWSSLDLDALAATARRLGGDVEFSRDAGGYVCNHLFFVAADLVATSATSVSRCGFVHLPQVTGPGEQLTGLADVVTAWLTENLTGP